VTLELELVVDERDHEVHAVFAPGAAQDLFGERILEHLLDRAAQRTGAVVGVVATLDEEVHRLLRQLERDVLLLQAIHHLAHLDVDDALEIALLELVEDHHLVNAVDELGPEVTLHFADDHLAHLLVGLHAIGLAEAETGGVLDQVGADVRRHDQDDVAEVDVPAERVGQTALFHHLEQHVEDVRVRLLDLVEQNDRVGATADLLGQVAALLVADVARRRADQARGIVLLHVLGHVDLDDRVLVAEHEARERTWTAASYRRPTGRGR
jgi:hypothetical protein